MGEPGEPGPEGPRGRDGALGYYPELWFGCFDTLDLVLDDGIEETAMEYTVTRFSNGDVAAECGVGLGSAETGADTAYYPGVVNGAESARCAVAVDYPPPGGAGSRVGLWEFTVDQDGPVAVYSDDASHPLDGDGIAFEEEDCGVQIGSAQGAWTRSTLADVF